MPVSRVCYYPCADNLQLLSFCKDMQQIYFFRSKYIDLQQEFQFTRIYLANVVITKIWIINKSSILYLNILLYLPANGKFNSFIKLNSKEKNISYYRATVSTHRYTYNLLENYETNFNEDVEYYEINKLMEIQLAHYLNILEFLLFHCAFIFFSSTVMYLAFLQHL